MNKKEVVSIVKCKNYRQSQIDGVVSKALELAEIKLPTRKKVLIKPNIVTANVKNRTATLTHPSVVKAVCKILKKKNCKIFVGESSFMDTVCSFKKSGIEKIAKKYGKIVIFDQEKMIRVKDNKAKILRDFYIPKIIKEVDLIINIPKLKTHQLTKYTGAIKNLYGCIPGDMKQKLHRRAPSEKRFSKLLVDIYQNIKPEINLMDAVIGMEGKGPTSGKSKKTGYVLASKNAVSLDVVASKLIGYKPKKIFAIKYAVKRKLGSFKVDVRGVKSVPVLNFEKPIVKEKLSKRILQRFREKPIVADEIKCIKCGLCARKCPMKAITLKPYPVINRKKCIRCFCCIEICPRHALSLKED